MTEYRCLTVAADGARIWRTVEATSSTDAVSRLVADGLTPLAVRSGDVTLAEQLAQPVHFGPAFGSDDLALLFSQLAVLVEAGLPLAESLDLLHEQVTRPRQKEELRRIVAAVREGRSFSASLPTDGKFPPYVTGVIGAGERSGRLAAALRSLADRLTVVAEARRELISALTYPAIVLAATVLAFLIVLLGVVPRFQSVLGGTADLPALTQVVFWLSTTVRDWGIFILLAVAGLAGWFVWRRKTGGVSLLDLRPVRGLSDQYRAGHLLEIIALMLTNGVRVVPALEAAERAERNPRWQAALLAIREEVEQGAGFSAAAKAHGSFPPAAIRLIQVGERTGRLAETCTHAGEIIRSAAGARIKRILAVVNPASIILLGALIAFLVAGVMLGIFALGNLG